MKIELKNLKYNEQKYVNNVTAELYVDGNPFSEIDFDGNGIHNSKHDDNISSFEEFHQQLPNLCKSEMNNIKELMQIVFLTQGSSL